jgi:hypothetical protein
MSSATATRRRWDVRRASTQRQVEAPRWSGTDAAPDPPDEAVSALDWIAAYRAVARLRPAGRLLSRRS